MKPAGKQKLMKCVLCPKLGDMPEADFVAHVEETHPE